MNCRKALLALAVILSSGCQAAAGEWRFSAETGDRMIGMCMDKLFEHTGKTLSDAAVRAYVFSRWDVSWIIFTEGEMGPFGEPEIDYRPHLWCSVATQPNLQVQELDEGFFKTIIDLEPKSYGQIKYLEEYPVVSLYQRDGSGFSYLKSRSTYSREEMFEKLDRMYESLDLPEILVIQ